ncbi:putative holin-like toxin [Marinilactibacillus sp. 15R]|nr:putative holin-like toxin [Marinilactibacillus sp. 15R]
MFIVALISLIVSINKKDK